MNKKDTKELQNVINQLKNLPAILNELANQVKEREKIHTVIEELKTLEPIIEDLMFQQQEKVDNLSDKARETYRGECIEQTAKYLEKAWEELTECISNLEYVIGE